MTNVSMGSAAEKFIVTTSSSRCESFINYSLRSSATGRDGELALSAEAG